MTKFLLVTLCVAGGLLLLSLIAAQVRSPARSGMTIQSFETAQPTFKPLTLEQIFSQNHQLKIPEDKKIVIIATGDIIPARVTNYLTVTKNDFLWPYKNTADVLKNADLTFINLETPLIQNCPVNRKGMVFCSDIRNIQGLTEAGVDVASLANNHAGNFGEAGVRETVDLLNEHGITPTGVAGPIYKQVKGVKLAFLGFNDIGKPQPGVENADEEKIKSQIAEARKNADVVIVTFHWGVEYRSQPDDRQKYLGHLAVESGADLVIGNHPHWIQPVEVYPGKAGASSAYKGKLIAYAHGNFVFDQEWSEKTKEGVVGRYTFYGKDLVDVEYLPVKIMDYGQPYFLEGAQKLAILEEMKRESEILASSSAN